MNVECAFIIGTHLLLPIAESGTVYMKSRKRFNIRVNSISKRDRSELYIQQTGNSNSSQSQAY